MADVQPLTGGVGELDQSVELRAGRVAGDGGVGLRLFPVCLPFFLNGCEIVLHVGTPFISYSNHLLAEIKNPRSPRGDQGRKKRDTTLLPPPVSRAALSAPVLSEGSAVTGRSRPALFRRAAPGPVQQSTPVGLHRPPTLFRRARLRFFPIIAIFTDYKLFYRFHSALSRAETENVCIAGQSRV